MAESSDIRLRRYFDRALMIKEEIADRQTDLKDLFAEMKAVGYDLATFRKVLARAGLAPAERAEADALLETYEAAIGGEAAAVPLQISASARELAETLLAAQIDGMEDPERAAAFVDHVLARLDIRAEIAVLRAQDQGRNRLAGGEGFDTNQLTATVRWYEKCAKHGLEEMKAGEQVFRLYRATVDEAGGPVRPDGAPPTADEKLAALFAKPAPKAPTAKQRAVSDAVAEARFFGKGRG